MGMYGNFSSFGPQKAVKNSKTAVFRPKMTISSQIPGACKTGSSERIQKYNRVHLPVSHRSIVSKFGVSTFRPHPNARDQKKADTTKILEASGSGPRRCAQLLCW